MTPKSCFTILHVSILAATLLTLEVSCTDECHVQIKVRRYTKYKAHLGEELKIDCPVTFCDDTPPEISWFKLNLTGDPINISGGSRFKSEWKPLKHLEGVLVLIIQNFVRNDSGIYWCGSSSSLGHKISVSVNDSVELITDQSTTSEPRRPETEDAFWPFVCRVIGLLVFVAIVIAMFVTSHCLRKGV
nr:B- and T-lymphocyte attenuator-like [Labrus bergylta]